MPQTLTRRHAVVRIHPSAGFAVNFYDPGDEVSWELLTQSPVDRLEPGYDFLADAFAAAWSGRFGERQLPEFVHIAPECDQSMTPQFQRYRMQEDVVLLGEPTDSAEPVAHEPLPDPDPESDSQPQSQPQETMTCVLCGGQVARVAMEGHNLWHTALHNLLIANTVPTGETQQALQTVVSPKFEQAQTDG
jgi:hypothetical protein